MDGIIKQNQILEKDVELEKRAKQINEIELKIMSLVDLICSVISALPINLERNEESSESEDQAIINKIVEGIEHFGPEFEEINNSLREHFAFFQKNGIRDRYLPINTKRLLKVRDQLLYDIMFTSLEQEIEVQNENNGFKRY